LNLLIVFVWIFEGSTSTGQSFIAVLAAFIDFAVFVVFFEVFEEFPAVVEFSDLVILMLTVNISWMFNI